MYTYIIKTKYISKDQYFFNTSHNRQIYTLYV